jgi:eukaryotic-like serine/threonine-protein kinase
MSLQDRLVAPESEPDPNKTVDLRFADSPVDDIGDIVDLEKLLDAANTPGETVPDENYPSRFTIGDEVGRGGMGEVHSCCDVHLNREVIAKVLHRKFLERPEVVARFREEIRITSQLEHSGVVPLYEAGTLPDGRPYFIMQRIWGLTLRSVLDERPNPNEGRTRLLKVFEQICHTIAYAHAQRIIHRDLNPSNVMLGLFGQVKVMDWGLAKALDETRRVAPCARPVDTVDDEADALTKFGSVMGTPAYMPPEQATGDVEKLDERCDVFGLGAILCEILTGQPPYVETSRKGVLKLAIKAQLDDAYARLDAARADRELVALAKTCLAADREERPRDAGVVIDRLSKYFDTVLRQAEGDLLRFFDLSLDLFCIAGFDGYFRRINDNFSRVLGYSTAELLAKPFLSFVHAEDQHRTMGVMAQLDQGFPLVRFRNRYRDVRGAYRWFEWTAKAVPKDDVIFAAARDVTEQVTLEERLKKLEPEAPPVPETETIAT